MQSIFMLPAQNFLIASYSLPSFDMEAALLVGVVVAAAVALALTAAIVTPFVAIQAANLLGAAITVGGIALLTGTIGAAAAGFYWGRASDIEHEKHIQEIASQSSHLHISFMPAAYDPKKAADFECNIIEYKEVDLNSRPPKAKEDTLHLTGSSASEFYNMVGQKLQQWFATNLLADRDKKPRTVSLYMSPNPGEGVFDRMKTLVEEKARAGGGGSRVTVQRVDGPWKSNKNAETNK